MTRAFDLVVVGSGSAAGPVASRCRKAGWTVAMIDKRPFGGTCALRGCDPKKVLVGAAATVSASRALSGKGVRAGGVGIDWADLIRFKRTFTDPVPEQRRQTLAQIGVETMEGVARFVGPTRLMVGDVTVEATRAIVIASGARPADVSIEGHEFLTTSDEFLELPALPPSLAYVGGGYISFEFAHVAARAGSSVTILHRGPRPLPQFDADLVDRLIASTRTAGIDVRLGAEVLAVDREGGDVLRVRFLDKGKDASVDAALVVHGAGRVPDLDDLMPGAGGVQVSQAGVMVNEFLQSVSNPLVWAAGDCAATDGLALTPAAQYEGRIVAANLLEGRHITADYRAMPSVVFTLPPLASVGVTEDEARAAGLDVNVRLQDSGSWYSTRRVGEEVSAFKVLVENGTRRIIGAHLLGPLADETINLFAVAMRANLDADQLKQMLWAYPTHASDTAYMIP